MKLQICGDMVGNILFFEAALQASAAKKKDMLSS
jgi:hypothetical protein